MVTDPFLWPVIKQFFSNVVKDAISTVGSERCEAVSEASVFHAAIESFEAEYTKSPFHKKLRILVLWMFLCVVRGSTLTSDMSMNGERVTLKVKTVPEYPPVHMISVLATDGTMGICPEEFIEGVETE